MVDIIILLLVLVLIFFAVKGSLKHFKGEGSCCGGGSGSIDKHRKKLDGPVLGKKNVRIEGMHCEHCAATVENAVNKIAGAVCKVDLKKNLATVSYDRNLDDFAIRKAIEDAGYTVVSIN